MTPFHIFQVCFPAFYVGVLAAAVFGLPAFIAVATLALITICVLDLRLRRTRRH